MNKQEILNLLYRVYFEITSQQGQAAENDDELMNIVEELHDWMEKNRRK